MKIKNGFSCKVSLLYFKFFGAHQLLYHTTCPAFGYIFLFFLKKKKQKGCRLNRGEFRLKCFSTQRSLYQYIIRIKVKEISLFFVKQKMLHRAFLDNKPSKVNHQKKFIETVLLQFGTKQIHNLQSIRNPDTIKIAANYHNQKMSKTIFEIELSRSRNPTKNRKI